MTPEERGALGRETAIYRESLAFIKELMAHEDARPADTLARYEIPVHGFVEVLVYLTVARMSIAAETDEDNAFTQTMTVAILLGAHLRSKNVI